jgi:tellurite resistance protein
MVLGIVGLGSAWRAAAKLWNTPAFVSESIMALGAAVWLILMLAYACRWVFNRTEAMAEVGHPIQCCFVSLVPATTTLMGLAVIPYDRSAALVIWVIGTVGQLGFGAWRSAGLWRGGMAMETVTPILYLPAVASNLISSIVAGALGLTSWGAMFLGMGVLSWLAIESALLLRLWTAPSLPLPLRPSLGIQMAPPVVAAVAYLANSPGEGTLLAKALWGYGLLQLLYGVRLLPWVLKQPFSASYWGYSFAATAVSVGALQLAVREPDGAAHALALPVFLLSNLVIAWLVGGTLLRLLQGRLLPAPLSPSVL